MANTIKIAKIHEHAKGSTKEQEKCKHIAEGVRMCEKFLKIMGNNSPSRLNSRKAVMACS